MKYATLWTARVQCVPLAVPVHTASRVRMVARNQERKTASKPQETVAFRDKSVNNLTIRHHCV
jgi:hypothetical protein